MPELPEVETVKNSIQPVLLGKIIKQVTFNRENLRTPLPFDKLDFCKNAEIISLKRIAKYIVINLSSDYSLVIHLGMSGRIFVQNLDYKHTKHDHVIIELENNLLIFNDPRRFGVFDIIKTRDLQNSSYFKNMGPEPLTKDFDENYLQKKLKNKSLPIKATIMDNAIVVGVGNIYASESLFLAKINPLVSSNSLNLEQLKNLAKAIKMVLQDAIKAGGSTIKDYKIPDGREGYFQTKFQVYGKDFCTKCGGSIFKVKTSGRATYYCKACQI